MKNKGSPEGFYKLPSSALVIPDGPLSFFTPLCDSCFKDLEEVGGGGGREVGKGNGWILKQGETAASFPLKITLLNLLNNFTAREMCNPSYPGERNMK